MAIKKTLTPRGKHRGEHFGRGRVVAGATVMALGVSSLAIVEGPALVASAAYKIDDLRASQGPHIAASEQHVPKQLPPAVAKAITETTVKIMYNEHTTKGGSAVNGTGVAVRGGFLTAAHVALDKGEKVDPCQNGLIWHDAYAFGINRRASVLTPTEDVAFLETDDRDSEARTAPLSENQIIPGDILYAASFQPVSDEQDRGPGARKTKGSTSPYEFTKPVIAAAIALGQDQMGRELFLTGVHAYGQEGAAGESYIQHGASGGGLFTSSGEVSGVVTSLILDGGVEDDVYFTKRQIQRDYGLTLEGADPDRQYQIMSATPVTNKLADSLATITQNCPQIP